MSSGQQPGKDVRVAAKEDGFSDGRSPVEHYIVVFDIDSGRWRVLQPLVEVSAGADRLVTAVGWSKSGEELLVTHETAGKPSAGTAYRFTRSGVTSEVRANSAVLPAPKSALGRELKVKLLQSASAPPKVVASDSKRSATLIGPDPVIEAVHLQKSAAISWQEPNGKTSTGLLTLPLGFRPGAAVPLVIHTYFVRPQLFLPDGPNRAVEAGQALAARGMAVLMMEMPLPSETEKEGPTFVARIDAAVAQLAREGIVDPMRVGITGFSHAGYEVLYAITHPGQVHLAAAVGADFFAGTYSNYLTEAPFVSQSSLGAYEMGPGGSFWDKRLEWSQYDSTFNANRVVTPFMLTYHGFSRFQRVAIRWDPDALLGIVGAFMRNDKPVEYLYMAHSQHELSRPLERLAATGAMLDWMAFWLQGYEDPSPSKATQYLRWRPMRQQQARSEAQVLAVQGGASR